MEYIEVAIRDEFIRLGQAMKLAGILSMGSEIKYEIVDGNVKVNGDRGDVFTYQGQDYKIV